jgi:hypothetical protein
MSPREPLIAVFDHNQVVGRLAFPCPSEGLAKLRNALLLLQNGAVPIAIRSVSDVGTKHPPLLNYLWTAQTYTAVTERYRASGELGEKLSPCAASAVVSGESPQNAFILTIKS